MPTYSKMTFLLIGLVLCLTACRSAPDTTAEIPVEKPGSETETDAPLTVANLLPQHTAAVVAFRTDEIHALAENLPALDPMLEMLLGNAPFPPALQDALQSPAFLQLDSDSPVFLALSLSGHEEFFTSIGSGGSDDEIDLPEFLHLRLILTSPDAAGLQERLLEQCLSRAPTGTEKCAQFVHIETRENWVTVDMALSTSGQWLSEVDADLSAHTDGGLHDTTAWRALQSDGAVIALHTTFSALFDLRALMTALETAAAAKTGPDHANQIRHRGMANVRSGYLLDNPEIAEFEDATFRLESHDGVLTIDVVGTLTEYGQIITAAAHRDASLSSPTLTSPAVDIQWGFDLRGVRDSAQPPLWAQPPSGFEQTIFASDDLSISDRLLKMRADTPRAFLLFLARSPATTYALFDELFGEETTPSDFSRVQGLQMQLGLQKAPDGQENVIATMGLDLFGEEDLLPYEQFARAALLPFGTGANIRTLDRSPSTELQTSIGLTSEDAFTDQVRDIETGVSATIDLAGVRALYRVLEGPSQPDLQIPSLATLGFFDLVELALPFTATIPSQYQQIRAHATIRNDQSIFRIQLGGDQLIPISAFPSGITPPAQIAASLCRDRALRMPSDIHNALEEVAPEQRLTLLENLIEEYDQLAVHCTDTIYHKAVLENAQSLHEFNFDD